MRCGACEAACPQSVHAVSASRHTVARGRCHACGKCVEACLAGALSIKGERVPAARIAERAARLKPFFAHSGGGLTLTGGEVTAQPAFAEAMLARCRARGIHTAIETCGACAWEPLERLVAHSDLVLYDLKLIDDAEHRRWTGASNRQILRNAARLRGHNVEVRVPLIPRVTDGEENLGGIFAFLRDVGLHRLALLPFNPSTAAKYDWLGLRCEVEGEPQTEGRLAELADRATRAGLEAAIV